MTRGTRKPRSTRWWILTLLLNPQLCPLQTRQPRTNSQILSILSITMLKYTRISHALRTISQCPTPQERCCPIPLPCQVMLIKSRLGIHARPYLFRCNNSTLTTRLSGRRLDEPTHRALWVPTCKLLAHFTRRIAHFKRIHPRRPTQFTRIPRHVDGHGHQRDHHNTPHTHYYRYFCYYYYYSRIVDTG